MSGGRTPSRAAPVRTRRTPGRGLSCRRSTRSPARARSRSGRRAARCPGRRYEQRVAALTYAVLPYRPHHALASSGAILDAFAHAKPCIALRTPLFEEYFAAMGDIGYLCDDEEEMTDCINQIVVCGPDARYEAQRRNIVAGRDMFSSQDASPPNSGGLSTDAGRPGRARGRAAERPATTASLTGTQP